MRNALPKVLHPLAERTLIEHVLASAAELEPAAAVLVDAEAFNKPTEDALSIGIPVIGYNADTEGNARLAYVGQSLYQSGYNIAQKWLPMVKPGGKVMLSMGQYEQAMVDIGTSKSAKVDDISKEPPSQEELSRLIADYDKNLKLFPGSTESLYNRGLLYLIKGDYARAAADFNKVVTLTKKANLTSDYAVCFGSIALRLDNKNPEEAQLTSKYLQINRSETMPEEVRKFLENKNVTLVIFKDMSGKVEQKTRVLTLFGLDAYARGNKVKAREYLNAVKNGGEPSMDEFALALAYLKKVQ